MCAECVLSGARVPCALVHRPPALCRRRIGHVDDTPRVSASPDALHHITPLLEFVHRVACDGETVELLLLLLALDAGPGSSLSVARWLVCVYVCVCVCLPFARGLDGKHERSVDRALNF